MSSFESLDALLAQWMEQRQKKPEFLPQNLSAAWTQIAGPLLARHSKPVRLTGDTLSIEVSSEAWGQALALQKPFLLLQLKSQLPELPIRNIQFFAQGSL